MDRKLTKKEEVGKGKGVMSICVITPVVGA